MITGDHPSTALTTAGQLGTASASETAITGRDLDAMKDKALGAQAEGVPLAAASSP